MSVTHDCGSPGRSLFVMRCSQGLPDSICAVADRVGWLLHEAGRYVEAERVYRDAIRACNSDPLLMYNLGVLLDDMGRKTEAMEAYEAALRGNPGFADCHYNLALLCEELKKPKEAIRHMALYRRLIWSKTE